MNYPVLAFAGMDLGDGMALYAGGGFTTAGMAAASHIARWDGTGWTSLGGAGGASFDDQILAMALFDDGSGPALYAAGEFTSAGGSPGNHIARWDGTSWTSVGGGTDGVVRALAVHDDGSGPALFAAGDFLTAGGSSANRIARWNGTNWTALRNGLTGGSSPRVYALAVFDDGSGPELYVGGSFTTAGLGAAASIAKWNGLNWDNLGNGVTGGVRALAVFDDGHGTDLFVGGSFSSAGGGPIANLARWNGSGWSDVGGGISGSVYSLVVHDEGAGPSLVAGGYFWGAGGSPASSIARWDGAGWSNFGPDTWWDTVFSLSSFDDGTGPALYAGGTYLGVGSSFIPSIARWKGSAWRAVAERPGQGIDGGVSAFHVFDDGNGASLFVGGVMLIAGSISPSTVARWSGVAWSPVGHGLWGDGQSYVRALVGHDDGTGPALFAAGFFRAPGLEGIARWDGSTWSNVGTGISLGSGSGVYALCVFDDGNGPALFAGGNFSSPTRNIAKWDGSSWSPLGTGASPGTDSDVFALAVYDDGQGPALYAGGSFTQADGVPASRIARWDGNAWTPLGTGMDGYVYALAVHDDGSGPALYAGGTFATAGGIAASRIARWNGSTWAPVGGGADAVVYTLGVFDDGGGTALYAGGEFASLGTVSASRIGRWDGSAWSPLDAGMDGVVWGLGSFDDGSASGPALYAGGEFSQAGGEASLGIAQWRACSGPGVPICLGDSSEGACPCSNSGDLGHGCQNSAGTGGALLTSSGAVNPDTAVLMVAGERPTSLTIFLQGRSWLAPLRFGDGLRCVGGSLKRLYVKTASGGQATAPAPGDLPIRARSAVLGDPIADGSTRHYLAYYRDGNPGFCPPPAGSTFNSSNGLTIRW